MLVNGHGHSRVAPRTLDSRWVSMCPDAEQGGCYHHLFQSLGLVSYEATRGAAYNENTHPQLTVREIPIRFDLHRPSWIQQTRSTHP